MVYGATVIHGRCDNFKNSKEDSEDTEESPAGYAEEGKQNEGK